MMKRMVKDDTAVFHAFASNHVTVRYDDWRGMGTRPAMASAALKLKGPSITAQRNGSKTDGWISQKAVNMAERIAADGSSAYRHEIRADRVGRGNLGPVLIGLR